MLFFFVFFFMKINDGDPLPEVLLNGSPGSGRIAD